MSINTSKNWKVKPLCEVTDVIMGQSPASKYYNFEGEGLPFFQGKTEFGEFYPTARKWCSKPNKIAKDNDILISVRAPVGPTNIANQECCIGRGLAAIRPLDELPHKYILYFLRSIEQQIESLGTGTTFKAISGQTLRNLSVPIAPPEQQKQIVEEIEKQFSRLDKTIADLKRVKANLKRYKASVLQAAVTGKLTEQWRKQNPDVEPASKLLERILIERRQKWEATELAKMTAKGKPPKNDKWKEKYKEPTTPDTSKLLPLPKGWIWSTFEQVSERVTVGHVGSMKNEYLESGIPFLRSQNVRENRYDSKGLKFVSPEFHKKLSKSSLKPGDILVVRSGSVGVTCVVPDDLCEANCSDLVIVKHPKAISSKYGAYYMNSIVNTRVAAQKVGIALTHFNTKSVAEMPLPLPSTLEQEAIIEEVEKRISVSEELERTVNTNLKRAERLRQSILKQAFSGKLV